MRRVTLQAPELLAEAPRDERALRLRDLLPIGAVLAIGLGCRHESAHRHPLGPCTRAIVRAGHARILPSLGTATGNDRRRIGTRLAQELQAETQSSDRLLRIHVERFNPALRLHERLGFREIEDKGVYLVLEWKGPSRSADALIGD
jgi:hypothetical protein